MQEVVQLHVVEDINLPLGFFLDRTASFPIAVIAWLSLSEGDLREAPMDGAPLSIRCSAPGSVLLHCKAGIVHAMNRIGLPSRNP